jgi:prepilin peptidase CpaA
MTISPQIGLCVALGLAASVEDLARRQISNWIPLAGLAGGLAIHVAERGWMGLLAGLGGAVGGFLAFLIFYMLGGMGGGDVKLMGGFGAIVGTAGLLQLTLGAALIGGLAAAGALIWIRIRRWRGAPARPEDRSIPYAPAIALGAWVALLN